MGKYTSNSLYKIREDWVSNEVDEQACIDFWNLYDLYIAAQNEIKIPTFENDSFLKILQKEKMLKDDGISLDIGCGTGNYSIALSKSFKELVGIENSEEMIRSAEAKATLLGVNNIDFICNRWQNIDIKEAGLMHKFDLVFANMTNAVNSANSFEKMIETCKGYCVMSKSVGRIDSISDKLLDYMGIKRKYSGTDAEVICAFKLLKTLGYKPQIAYENKAWNAHRPIKQATQMYINRVKMFKNISTEDEKEITEFLKIFENSGEILEKSNALVITMYWNV